MRKLFSGENRRAAILAAMGAPVIVALLVFRLFSGGETDPPAPALPALPTVPVPPAEVAAPAGPLAAPSPPVDPALLRDPFCPLATAPGAPGTAPVACRSATIPPERQAVALEDIFSEGDVRLARMHVDEFTFPNLHEGETVAGSFRVVSLAERCGEFESAGSPFSLCVGEQTFR